MKNKKPSLRQQIENLQLHLESKSNRVGTLESFIRDVATALGISVWTENSKILDTVKELWRYRQEYQGTIDITNAHLMEENSKLWHMLRSMTGDETLISSKKADPSRLGGQHDTFNQPYF